MSRLIGAMLAIYAVIATLLWASCYGDKPQVLVDASPACGALPNPCDTIDCYRVNPASIS